MLILLKSELNEVVYLELPLTLELCIVSFPIEVPNGYDAYGETLWGHKFPYHL